MKTRFSFVHLLLCIWATARMQGGIIGPEPYFYTDVQVTTLVDACGTSVDRSEYTCWPDGSRQLKLSFKEDDCWNAVYGLTDYSITKVWPIDELPYTARYGWIAGIMSYSESPNTDSPPDLEWIHWQEQRTFDLGGGAVGTFSRTADMSVRVSVTANDNGKPDHLVPLYASVTKWEFVNGYWQTTGQVPNSQVTVGGGAVDCNGSRHLVMLNNTSSMVTPVAAGLNNYSFSCGIEPVKKVWKSMAYHPMFSSPPTSEGMQTQFNSASVSLLAGDADSCISWNASGMFPADDVRRFVEFFITSAQPNTFPATMNTTADPFNHQNFYNVSDYAHRDALLEASFSQIKVVRKLYPVTALGWANTPGDNMILVGSAYSSVMIHEWLHNTGCHHRGTTFNPDKNGNDNELFSTDTEAIMYRSADGGLELNRNERGYTW